MTAPNESGPAPDAPPPLAPEWLLEPLPQQEGPGPDLEPSDSRFEEINALILRGEYLQAGRRSEELLQSGVHDVRVFGYYTFAVFIERGLPSLSLVFRLILSLLGTHYAAFGPANKKQLQTENMLLWLLSGILKNVELHGTLKDSTWKEWMEPRHRAALDEAVELCPQVQLALGNFAPKSRAGLRFQSLDGWLSGLGHGETGISKPSAGTQADSKNSKDTRTSNESREGRDKPEPEKAPKEDLAEESDEDENEDEDEDEDAESGEHSLDEDYAEDEAVFSLDADGEDPEAEDAEDAAAETEDEVPAYKPGGARHRAGRDAPAKPEAAVPAGSPDWQHLRQRLDAFAVLIKEGQYLKAAVLATDIQAKMSAFDPVAYFPEIFAPYLEAFAEHMRPLEHYLDDTHSLKFKVLQKLYLVDFEKFMRKA